MEAKESQVEKDQKTNPPHESQGGLKHKDKTHKKKRKRAKKDKDNPE